MTELWQQSASELAAMIAGKEVSSVEVIDAHLARIEQVNPHLNAITRVLADEARAGAKAADASLASGDALGPLHGVPLTVKQNIDLAGCATDNGVPAFAEAISPVDAPVVERMRAAGAIPIGRTNCPDMALRVHTDSSLHGLTRNPWDPTRTAGGSSGGEASALASGMSPIGLGNDIGGSLRNPATLLRHRLAEALRRARAGVRLRPDGGRTGLLPADARRGPDGSEDRRRAPRAAGPRRPRSPRSVLGAGTRSTRRCPRAGRCVSPCWPALPGGSTDPRVADCVTAAADALADAGYDVTESGPPRFEEVLTTWFAFIGEDIRTMSPLITPIMSDDAQRVPRQRCSTRSRRSTSAATRKCS